jgi:hypothetical protein
MGPEDFFWLAEAKNPEGFSSYGLGISDEEVEDLLHDLRQG